MSIAVLFGGMSITTEMTKPLVFKAPRARLTF